MNEFIVSSDDKQLARTGERHGLMVRWYWAFLVVLIGTLSMGYAIYVLLH